MGDARSRELERRWRASGDEVAYRAWQQQRARAGELFRFGSRCVTRSPQLARVYDAAAAASAHERPIVILGERGSGRRTLARAIHEAGPRSSEPFLLQPALPETLWESEVFGCLVGTFTGVPLDRIGSLQRAGRGTLVLHRHEDEPCPEYLERWLRRALVEGQARRVGALDLWPVRARCVFVTTSLAPLEPLLDGLQPEVLRLPPLRERLADLPFLLPGADPERLAGYDWPENLNTVAWVLAQLELAREPELAELLLKNTRASSEVPDRVLAGLLERAARRAAPSDGAT